MYNKCTLYASYMHSIQKMHINVLSMPIIIKKTERFF
jgi:hypothetical protein